MYIVNKFHFSLIVFFSIVCLQVFGQQQRFQQSVDYTMVFQFNLKKHQYDGRQTLKYTNHSGDTLRKVFYHLYFNAFKPGSVMDVRSRTIKDPDARVGGRIMELKKSEQGFMQVNSLTMDGMPATYKEEGTILEVVLPKPMAPGQTVTFDMEFLAQIPLQIRRTGRNNTEGIEYSVAQGYPKICGYDEQGWHANPYIGREFYGPWGNFDVTIYMNREYVLGATGILQNPEEVGYGYTLTEPERKEKLLKWHFKAENVHDFVWAADPDYVHTTYSAYNGTILRFFYQPGPKTTDNWTLLPAAMDEALKYLNSHYGEYPYRSYSFIQGGDGGMEYPMATLITGERSLVSLVGVSVHELVHSWYQGMLASNEALYAWMDEGFTSYVSTEVMNHLKRQKLIPGLPEDNPQLSAVKGYVNFTQSGLEEPLITHADHFNTNAAYGMAAYTKGQVLLEQLRYIMGDDAFKRGMLQYFKDWKFKHPNANDFIRVMEKVSDLELDWFREYFVNSVHTIDYEVEKYGFDAVILKRNGRMPMPLDITITLMDGKVVKYYVPVDLMRGEKKGDQYFSDFIVAKDWPWAYPDYVLDLGFDPQQISRIEIDASGRMADVNRANNFFPRIGTSEEDLTK